MVILDEFLKSFTTSAVNTDIVFKLEMLVQQNNDSGDWRTIPWIFNNNSDDYGTPSWAGGFYFNGTSGRVYMQIGSDLSNIKKMIFIVEYTKN